MPIIPGLQSQVKKLLEPYVELGSDFSFSLRNSSIRNARLKPNCLEKFGFPVEITSGVIGSLTVAIEFSSKPRLEITAKDIAIVIDTVAADNAELRAFLSQLKMQRLDNVILSPLQLRGPL